MAGRQRILPVRRDYNRWVANQTLEDYALRFTAKSARRWTAQRVSQTAIGAISFLALEAVGGAITLSFGFVNAACAIVVVSAILLLTGIPISRYAAKYGVDIDLLTRGAGFGYIGSTVTSLIYASFTFILFAVEASIMTAALELAFGVPLWLGYIVSALAVIPLVTHGVSWISRFQLLTQPLWIVLNVLPVGFILWKDAGSLAAWTAFPGLEAAGLGLPDGFDLLKFGAASAVILALMPQIGEQVDILRFLPARKGKPEASWRFALFAAGPGWIVLGAPKLFFGSFLAVLALRAGLSPEHAVEPAYMYDVAFSYVLPSPGAAAVLTAAFVVVSQLKINVMNAYAGSLAWSNFFSRLTHSHPGRVVWLVFNVAIALLLMELGIYGALEVTFGLFANVAVAWLGTLVADLAINKPLGLSPPGIEFKRAHLYDVNPVGLGSMGLAALVSLTAFSGAFGAAAAALSPFLALAVALLAAPAIAYATGGRYYLARRPRAEWANRIEIDCSICEHAFEPEDMAYCPAYAGPICSLCCSLDARCGDLCKPHARLEAQVAGAAHAILPARAARRIDSRLGHYLGSFALLAGIISIVLGLIYYQAITASPNDREIIAKALWAAFFILLIVAGIGTWFVTLARESRRVAQEESARQTVLLLKEIEAHRRTDAALQKAKETAEAASLAKSRYVVGMSHELRTPLNAVLGYAQLLERDEAIPLERRRGVKVIRRSAEHLSGLIDGLLDISRIETGRLQLQRGEVRLADFLSQIVDMFRLQAEARGLAFTYVRPDVLPETVRTDEKRLRQILINLLSNAVKYTETGTVGLEVSYRSQIATLAVTDTGPGIAPDEIGRIFDPFERGSATLGATSGLGLGLTITRLLANLMGGDVNVRSVPGEGSRFEVRVMLSSVAGPAKPRPGTALPRGYEGRRRTIFVVDDDEVHRELMLEVLRPLGFIVLTAADGPSALDLVSGLAPDLFLLDIQMPGMNGWTLARALREAGQDGAILMLSATLGEPPVSAVGEPPAHPAAQGALSKPVDLRELVTRLGDLLALDWTQEPQAAEEAEPAALSGPVAPPPPADLAELLRLGRIGYVRGIEVKLAALEADAALAPFVEAMRVHVRGFDLKRYVAELEAMANVRS
ncbi:MULTISPECIES: ATP-binding protein [unclassified Aureimonas]|uniref:hybrid sensor histidine kinase/response regulator n=1 Tax=unclassified Aureimonas TaxID=2615206 RepID=UPI0006FC9C24|nr:MULTISPECIES: ATP-binding protein [unclassified Aureimonas]KQT69979.1 ATPase [Aureimonas sp. Leaf427]KQT75865.1 ATPase [Aureimonas sp. Leaf460]